VILTSDRPKGKSWNIELTFYDLLDQLHTGHNAPGVDRFTQQGAAAPSAQQAASAARAQ
jgi:hypothetical protein